jgi:hypothetical protein
MGLQAGRSAFQRVAQYVLAGHVTSSSRLTFVTGVMSWQHERNLQRMLSPRPRMSVQP